jgi:hypothetical protein
MSGARSKLVVGSSILATALVLTGCGATGTGGDAANAEVSMTCAGEAYDKVLLRAIDGGHSEQDRVAIVNALRLEGGGSGEDGEISSGARRRVVNAAGEENADVILDEYQQCFDSRT